MKQPIKMSEARIIMYLNAVHNTRKHVTAISNKLDIDYSYLMRILQAMVAKGWLTKHRYIKHVYYDLTSTAPMELARAAYSQESRQMDLTGYETEETEVKQ